MNRQWPLSICIWTAAIAMPVVSHADIMFSNFGAGYTYNTAVGNVVGNGFDGNDYAEADTFTPGVTATFTSLEIALSCVFTCTDNFTVALTTNSGDAPSTALESFTVAGSSLGTFGANNPPIVLNSVLNPVLTAGTQYWIAVSSDLNNSIEWNVNSTGDASDQAISTDSGATWFSPSGQTPGAYEVDGTPVVSAVPEPGSIALLFSACILCGIGAASRARHRR
jgi:hypothetical protein